MAGPPLPPISRARCRRHRASNGFDVRLFSCSPDSRGLGTLRSDWMVDVWRLLDACRVSDVPVVAEAGLQTALGDDLDPAPSGIGHGNFFVFVDASARRNSRPGV